MLNVKAEGQHTRQPVFNLLLQSLFLIRIITIAQHSGHSELLMLVLNDAHSTESNYATEESGLLLRLNNILLDDAERCLVTTADSIHLVAALGAVEV